MNLFPYASAIALSRAGVGLLSPEFILNLMQFIVHWSVETIPCLIAFFFSEAVFHRSRVCQNRLCSLFHHSLQT